MHRCMPTLMNLLNLISDMIVWSKESVALPLDAEASEPSTTTPTPTSGPGEYLHSHVYIIINCVQQILYVLYM